MKYSLIRLTNINYTPSSYRKKKNPHRKLYNGERKKRNNIYFIINLRKYNIFKRFERIINFD